MKVTTEQAAKAVIAKVEGRVDSSNAAAFESALGSVFSASNLATVIDCEALTYISSAGLRVVLLAAKTLRQQNREFKVCSLTASIQELFEISGFDRIINIYPSRGEALAALES